MKPAGEEVPTPCEAGALEPGEAKAPSITEATKGEAEAPRTSEAEVAKAGAPETTEAEAAEAGLGVVELAAQDAEIEVGQASVPPLV
jgi:hypothetical protein